MYFKDRLKQLRDLSNVTQLQLSKKINASQSKIAMWETGNRDPNSEDIIFLADLFNVSTDYLLGRSDNPQMYTDQKIDLYNTLTENETELLEIFRRITNEREQTKLIGRFDEIVEQMTNTSEIKSNDAPSTPSKENVG